MTNNKLLNKIYDITPISEMDETSQSELAEVMLFEQEDEEKTEQVKQDINDTVKNSFFGSFQLC